MLTVKKVPLIGYASGIGGADSGSVDAVDVLQQSPFLADRMDLEWIDVIKTPVEQKLTPLQKITQQNTKLSRLTYSLAQQHSLFVVLGGDHTSAIGSWSGVACAKRAKGPIGLIWIDAHMDSHTPETTLTGNIHGMPLACLLGKGEKGLTEICDPRPKLLPEHICLIGVRSYEEGEALFLKRLGARIFFMDEIKQRGLAAVFAEAVAIANRASGGFGLSIDIDSVDPLEAPGTGVAEPDGLSGQELCSVLTSVYDNPALLGAEIVEFNPHRDKDHLTEKLIAQILLALTMGKVLNITY